MAPRKKKEAPIEETIVEVLNEVNLEDETPVTITGVVVNCELLNVRQSPDVKSSIVDVLSKGKEVSIIEGANDKFYKTTIGYVMKEFIELK